MSEIPIYPDELTEDELDSLERNADNVADMLRVQGYMWEADMLDKLLSQFRDFRR